MRCAAVLFFVAAVACAVLLLLLSPTTTIRKAEATPPSRSATAVEAPLVGPAPPTPVPSAPAPVERRAAPEHASVEGVVLSPEGRPVGGASVCCGRVAGVTDADGAFALDGIPPGRVDIVVRCRDYPPAVERLRLREGERRKGLLLVLADGMTVRGRVVDEAGGPVPDAAAVVLYHLPPATGAAVARSGKDGGFLVSRVPPQGDEMMLTVRRNGYLPAYVHFKTAAGAEVDVGVVVLRSGLSVSGRVTDTAARPIAGARVSVVGLTCGSSALTDRDGFFSVGGLAAGRVRVAASADGFLYASIEVEAGCADADLVLRRAATLRVNVRLERPERYVVRLEPRDGTMTFEKTPDAAGHARMESVPPGRWRLLLLRDGRVAAERETTLSEGETLSVDLP